MTINTAVEGSEATIAVEGWLDTQASPELLAQIDQLQEGINTLVLDFSRRSECVCHGVCGRSGAV